MDMASSKHESRSGRPQFSGRQPSEESLPSLPNQSRHVLELLSLDGSPRRRRAGGSGRRSAGAPGRILLQGPIYGLLYDARGLVQECGQLLQGWLKLMVRAV